MGIINKLLSPKNHDEIKSSSQVHDEIKQSQPRPQDEYRFTENLFEKYESASFSPHSVLTRQDVEEINFDSYPMTVEEMEKNLPEFFQLKRQRFLESIQILKCFGQEITLGNYVLDHNHDGGATTQTHSFRKSIKRTGLKIINKNDFVSLFLPPQKYFPDNVLLSDIWQLTEIDPGLNEEASKKRKVSYLSVHYAYDSRTQTHHIVFFNWFEDQPVFDYKTQNLKEGLRQMRQAVKEHLKTFDVEKALESIPELTESQKTEINAKKVYTTQPVSDIPSGLKQALELFDVEMFSRPYDSDLDRDSELFSPLLQSTALQLNKNQKSQFEDAELKINGNLEAVELTIRDLTLAKKMYKDLEGKIPFAFKDKYGNHIYSQIATDEKAGESWLHGFVVEVPFHFYEGQGDVTSWHLDLSRFGFSDYVNLARIQTIPESSYRDERSYRFFNATQDFTGDQENLLYQKASDAIWQVEKDFGVDSGEIVKNVLVAPSIYENASVRYVNPETIIIWDEIVERVLEEEGEFVVRHEAFHSMDMTYGITQDPEFKKLFSLYKNNMPWNKRVKENPILFYHNVMFDMFRHINESHFLDSVFGGHSRENKEEFFASLIHTLYAANWAEKVSAKQDLERAYYYYALKALNGALMRKLPHYQNTEICKKLKRAISDLERKYEFPFFSEITFERTATDILKESPVRIVKTTQELNALKREGKPLLVFNYEDKHQDQAVLFQQLALRYGDRVNFAAKESGGRVELFPRRKVSVEFAPQIYLFYGPVLMGQKSPSDERGKYIGSYSEQGNWEDYDTEKIQQQFLDDLSSWLERWLGNMVPDDLSF